MSYYGLRIDEHRDIFKVILTPAGIKRFERGFKTAEEAMEETIAKYEWLEIVLLWPRKLPDVISIQASSFTCPLCRWANSISEFKCSRCPIYLHNNAYNAYWSCLNTPWDRLSVPSIPSDMLETVRSEIRFLKEVQEGMKHETKKEQE